MPETATAVAKATPWKPIIEDIPEPEVDGEEQRATAAHPLKKRRPSPTRKKGRYQRVQKKKKITPHHHLYRGAGIGLMTPSRGSCLGGGGGHFGRDVI